MTDQKNFSRSRRKTPKTRRKARKGVPRGLGLNSMMLKTAWTLPAITTGTTGTIAYTSSPSIANSPEYSVLQSLFTEVKLVRFTVVLTPIAVGLASIVHGSVIMGTNMRMNQAIAVNPAAANAVENTTKVQYISTTRLNPIFYRAPVPRDLMFSDLVADAPNPVTPFAGSPGTVLIFGTAMTVSTAFFAISQRAVYILRGRT